jgi:hypothetical protein
LDPYGTWVNVDSYGWVWHPRVHVGWAPYRYGRWAWVDWYGWTWVSSDPWGWAPYHYGRWFHHAHHGWLWHPGGLHRRHYWSPALVAFFGIGSVQVGVGFGRVGWIPLAPYEPYYPWYGRRYYGGYRSGFYGHNNVHVVNNINITKIYRNSRVGNGITAWDRGDFARGRSRDFIRVTDRDIRDVRLVRGQVPVAPERDSMRFSDRQVRGDAGSFARAESANSSRFYSRRQPAAVDRVPFEEQRRGLERLSRGERTVADSRGGDSPRGNPERGVAPAAGSDRGQRSQVPGRMDRNASNDSRGWRRFGEPEAPAAAARSRRESRPATESSEGWRTFGAPGAGSATRSFDGANGRPQSEQGWRRVGESGAAGAETRSDSGRTTRRDSSQQWQRFGEQRGSTPAASPSAEQGSPSEQRPGRDSSWTRFGSGRPDRGDSRSGVRTDSGSRPESNGSRVRPERLNNSQDNIRLSPPVIRERAPRTERQENGRVSRGESRFSGSSASRSQGSVMRSTPRMQGGGASIGRSGGGRAAGGGRPSGGAGRSGGGGGRSGGGGRQR